MDRALYERASAVFLRACGVPVPDRSAFLDEACAGAADLRAEVEKLLAHDRQPIEFVEAASRGGAVEQLAIDLARSGDVPARIGRFQIIRVIGEGGMGIVYEAQQDNPQRRVALKVIRPGMVTRSLLHRFRHEVQVLGQLRHPGIAQIYEAGTADAGEGGQPWFAMELVSGRPLLEYAETKRLDTRARLEVIAAVCDALHHAHQKGVIHRDLKPGNILVEETGQPKILDFGVARLTDADVNTVTMQTDVGQLVGTLPYMSPEQAAGDPAAIDIRSDVYSLGVITFEILSGGLPYPAAGKLIHEAVRTIREDEPSRLSSVDRAYRGDIETIVAKALEKDKERRYQSAAELAADIRRHLLDQPIVARPASALYQWRKFARRNRRLVAAVGAAFAVLLIATIVSLRLLVLAGIAREDARDESYIARITAAASAIDGGDPLSARELLAAVPPERRNWEWRYHAGRLDGSILRIDLGEPVSSARFSADGAEIIAAASSGTISRWGIAGDGPRSSVALEGGPPGPIAFDRDGQLVAAATGTGQRIIAWATADGHRAAEFDVPIYEGASLHWTRVALGPAAGRLAVISGSRQAFLLGGAPEPMPLELAAHGGAMGVAISRDGQRAVVCWHDGLSFFDAVTGERLLVNHKPDVGLLHLVAFIGDGYQVTLGGRKRLFLWDPDHPELLASLEGHSGTVTAIACDASGRWLASGSLDTTVRVWDRPARSLAATLCGHDARIVAVDFHPDGSRILAAAADGTLRLWTREPDDRVTVLRGHRSYVYPVAFSADGTRIVSGAWDGDLRIWDAAGGSCLAVIPTGEPWVASLAIAPDDSYVVTGHPGGRIRTWDVTTGARIGGQDLPSHDVVNGLAFDRQTSDLLLRSNSHLRIIRSGRDQVEELMTEGWTEEQKSAVACSAVGPHVAVARQDRSVWILNHATGELMQRLEAAGSLCFALAFSPDGARVAAGYGDGTIRLWHARTGALIRTMTGHQGGVFALAFTPDGTRLASGSDDTSIRLWDPETGRQVALLPGHDDYVFSLAFSPDGATLVSGSGDSTLRVWDTRPAHERWRARARP